MDAVFKDRGVQKVNMKKKITLSQRDVLVMAIKFERSWSRVEAFFMASAPSTGIH